MEETAIERVILVVENKIDRAESIERAFLGSSIDYKISIYSSGREMMDFLLDRAKQNDLPLPDLILLDLDVPDGNGKEILSALKASSRLRRIPIVVLTASDRSEDIMDSYMMQGNCYVVKSSDLDDLFRVVKRIEEFWLQIVTLPTK
jgi:two-component system, chemotaxis family, response regulator Rcp1